MLIRDQ